MKKHILKKILLVIGIVVLVLLLIVGFFVFRFWRGRQPVSLSSNDSAVVQTTAGDVRGAINDGIYSYRGIPYAQANELFVPAEEVEPWTDVRDAIEYGEISKQGNLFGPGEVTEDGDNNCQNLNIWTPGLDDGGKRPVMVWLHGGGFSTGSANDTSSDGTNLSQAQDVVVVGVNHRLNLMGHLDLSAYGEKYVYSGNVGVDDIRLALQWIQDNIEAFGGDPDNVTVFGQSGGGAKIIALMNAPMAGGLFNKGIVQSGATPTMGETFASKEISERIAELVLEELGIDAANIEEIQSKNFTELSQAGDVALAQVAQEFQIPAPLSSGYSAEWGPVVDGNYILTQPTAEDAFSTSMDVPLLIGSNLNEWTRMGGSSSANGSEELDAAFAQAYPNLSESEAEYVDTLIRPSLIKLMSTKSDTGNAQVFSYVLTFGDGMMGSYHGVELPLVFGNASMLENAPNRAMAEKMSSLWASFARTGIPQADGAPEWEGFTTANGFTMILDEETMLAAHHDDNLLFLIMNEN